MRRRAFNFAVGVSLLVFVADAALCIRSFLRNDFVTYDGHAYKTFGVFNGKGAVRMSVDTSLWSADSPHGLKWATSDTQPISAYPWSGPVPGEVHWRFAGFAYDNDSDVGYGVVASYLTMPHWPVILLTAILPLIWLRWRLRRRYAAGHCPHCAYDLRATPDRCPECGTVPDLRG